MTIALDGVAARVPLALLVAKDASDLWPRAIWPSRSGFVMATLRCRSQARFALG